MMDDYEKTIENNVIFDHHIFLSSTAAVKFMMLQYKIHVLYSVFLQSQNRGQLT